MVLELEPPVTLASQQRIWGLADRLIHHADILEVIPGMNNLTLLLADPHNTALDAIERLQRWWEESESLIPESRDITIPVMYGGEVGPDLADVARHTGMSERQVVECHAAPVISSIFRLSAGVLLSGRDARATGYTTACRSTFSRCTGFGRDWWQPNGNLSLGNTGRVVVNWSHLTGIV